VAGHKQHYIPQFLLKGFETPSKGKTKKVVVFRRGQRPFVSPTEDVAAERHFYSDLSQDGSLTLDDQITEYENDLGRLLILLREAPLDSAVDATVAAEVITHLTIRGAHLRGVFSIGMERLLSGISDLFTDKGYLRRQLGVNADEPPPLVKEQTEKLLSEHADLFAMIGLPKLVIERVVFTSAKENFDNFYDDQFPFLTVILNCMAYNASTIARDGHTKALAASLKPDPRMAVLSRLAWTISAVPGGDLILPDCVALAMQSDSATPEPYVFCDPDKIHIVLLPISANKLLVGHRGDAKLSHGKDFNEAAAACSHSFFISACQTPELESLAEIIGERSQTTVMDAMNSALEETSSQPSTLEHRSQSMFQKLDEPVSRENEGAMLTEHNGVQETHDVRKLSYTISFLGCADKNSAEEIADAVKTIVSEMSRWMPLGRLDRITFASDYMAALREVDRGFSASAPLASTEGDVAVGVAMAPMVLRDGVAKVCIVMQGGLGHGLIGEDRDAQTMAIHALANQLAHVACVELVDLALPGVLLNRVEDDWEARLHVYTHNAWTAYFAARISAAFNPSIGTSYRDILLAFLEQKKETIPRERLAYRVHGDLDRFLGSAMSSIGKVMTYLAMLLGHCDGLDKSTYDEDGRLIQALEQSGLHCWVDTFRRDLAELFERRGQWESVQEFLALNRHAERILWQFGVFPWRNDEGKVRVEIPLWTDAAELLKN